MHDETPSWYFFQSMVVEARDLQPQRPREINGWRPSARKDSAKGWASFGGFEVKGFIGNHLRRILQTRQKMLCIWLNSPSSTYYLCYTYTSISMLIRVFWKWYTLLEIQSKLGKISLKCILHIVNRWNSLITLSKVAFFLDILAHCEFSSRYKTAVELSLKCFFPQLLLVMSTPIWLAESLPSSTDTTYTSMVYQRRVERRVVKFFPSAASTPAEETPAAAAASWLFHCY